MNILPPYLNVTDIVKLPGDNTEYALVRLDVVE